MELKERIEALEKELEELTKVPAGGVESFRIAYSGKKGHLKGLYEELKSVPNEMKKEVGQSINSLRMLVEEKISSSMLQSLLLPRILPAQAADLS